MRRFLLAAILFALFGMTAAIADDPAAPASQPTQPKVITADWVTTSMTTVAALEEELEVLETQRQAKKGYVKMAEVALKTAKMKDGQLNVLELEIEHAEGQVEVRSGELKEVEVKIKYAKQRLEKMKAVVSQKAKDKAVQAAAGLMGAAGFGGIEVLAGISEIQQPSKSIASASKIAVFNMAAVMKDYSRAKHQVYLLNEERKELSAEVAAIKAEVTKLQMKILLEKNQATKEEMEERRLELTREMEDKARRIDKQLNEKASKVIVELYDEIKAVVDEMAKSKGYDIVFAYPDATGPEANSFYVKELKLKPPAAQPFFVAKSADLTDEIIEKLNTRYPAPPVPASGANPNLVK